jgi:sulfoxide reductase heme-binding subunit YedZ
MRVTGLVRDPAGRFSWLKTGVLAGALVPALVLLARALEHDLGARPITEAIHIAGLWAVRFLLLTLAVTPARALLDWPRVVMLRRMLGVTTACYASLHLLLFALDQKWDLAKVATEIALRFYLTIGFVTLLGLLALAITSTDFWQRRLKQNWKRLHKIVYVLGVLALFHAAVQFKANIGPAVFLFGLFVWLLYWRRLPRRWQAKPWLILPLALAAGLSAAVAEAVWYAVRNHVDPLMILGVNLDLSYGPRPAVQVLLAGVALFVLVALVRLRRPRAALRPTRGTAPLTAGGTRAP